MDDAVRAYIDAIISEHRPLFDRVHRLIVEAHPDATMRLSYRMPTYEVGRFRLYVGAWRHGLSIYGWQQEGNAGFAARHPDLVTGKGTIRPQPVEAAKLSDEDLRDLVRTALGG